MKISQRLEKKLLNEYVEMDDIRDLKARVKVLETKLSVVEKYLDKIYVKIGK